MCVAAAPPLSAHFKLWANICPVRPKCWFETLTVIQSVSELVQPGEWTCPGTTDYWWRTPDRWWWSAIRARGSSPSMGCKTSLSLKTEASWWEGKSSATPSIIHLNSLDNVLLECVVTESGAPSLCLRCIAALIHGSHDLEIAYTKYMKILLKRYIVKHASNLQVNTVHTSFSGWIQNNRMLNSKLKYPGFM